MTPSETIYRMYLSALRCFGYCWDAGDQDGMMKHGGDFAELSIAWMMAYNAECAAGVWN